jgi:hypothetical protein
MHRVVRIAIALAAATVPVAGFGVAASASAKVMPRAASATSLGVAANGMTMTPATQLAADVLAGRRATAKYQTNLAAAKADGYRILTRMIPNMGYHFIDPNVKTFDVRKPPILVYEHTPHGWQLGAFEWTFPTKPTTPPLPGAQYGVFGAACHYVDGTFVYQKVQAKCAARSPQTGAAFNLWHPKLVTLHLWLWYPNPSGIFMGMNPLVTPFNRG